MTGHWQKLPRAAATIFLGALPASYLCVLPAMVVAGFLSELWGVLWGGRFDVGWFSGTGVLLLVWTGMAVYGTVCLWLIAFTGPRLFVRVGLVTGILAIAPILFVSLIAVFSDGPTWEGFLLVGGPFLTAATWLLVWWRSQVRKLVYFD